MADRTFWSSFECYLCGEVFQTRNYWRAHPSPERAADMHDEEAVHVEAALRRHMANAHKISRIVKEA